MVLHVVMPQIGHFLSSSVSRQIAHIMTHRQHPDTIHLPVSVQQLSTTQFDIIALSYGAPLQLRVISLVHDLVNQMCLQHLRIRTYISYN